jgi:hypothetical protein
LQKAENAEGQTPAIGPDGEVRNGAFLTEVLAGPLIRVSFSFLKNILNDIFM